MDVTKIAYGTGGSNVLVASFEVASLNASKRARYSALSGYPVRCLRVSSV